MVTIIPIPSVTMSGGVAEDSCRHHHFKSLPLSPRAASPHRTNYIIRLAMYKYNNNIILYTARAVKNISYYVRSSPSSSPTSASSSYTTTTTPQLLLLLLYSTLQSPRSHCHALHPLSISLARILFARSTQFQLKSLRYQFIIRDNNIHNHLFIYMYISYCVYTRAFWV